MIVSTAQQHPGVGKSGSGKKSAFGVHTGRFGAWP